IVLLNTPVSPRKWPVDMPEALAMVKVGNSECGLAKLTPLSRIAAMVGAVCGVTDKARRPSGTNRIRLRWAGTGDWAAAGAYCKATMAQAASRTVDLEDLVLEDMAALPIIFVQRRARYPHHKT